MYFKESFGKNLKQIRKSKNITQEALAEMIGIHPRQVSKLETGEHFPNATTLENICVALSVAPAALFNFKLEEISEQTGTGDKYTYKAVVEGNVIYLDNSTFRKQKVEKVNSSDEIDTKMLNLAKKTGKPITVQYFNENSNYKTIEYYPNGTYKIIKDDKEAQCEILTNTIKDLILKKGMYEYFNLSVEALSDSSVMEKFQCMLSGIKMGRK